MLKLATNLRWMFDEWPEEQRYAAAAAVGFKGVEMPFPYELSAQQMTRTLKDNGLSMIHIATPVEWSTGVLSLAAYPGRTRDFMKGVAAAIEYAARIGCPNIHVLPGIVPEGVERQHAMDVFLSNLAAAAEAAAAERITLTVEAVSRERNPAWVFHRLDEVQAVIKAIGRDNLKIVFDTFHVQTEEGNLFDRLSANFAQIGVIQIGNPPGRHEPGVGELDLLSFLAELERLGWNDWVSCEHIPSRGTLASLAWAAPFGISITAESLAAAPPIEARSRPIRIWRDMNKAN